MLERRRETARSRWSGVALAAFVAACGSQSGGNPDGAAGSGGTSTGSSGTAGGLAGNGGAGRGGAASGGRGGGTGGGGGAIGGAGGRGGAVAAGDSVLMARKNLSRDAHYLQPSLTKAAAAGLHKVASFNSPTFPQGVYAQPLFVDGGGAARDLVFVATEGNDVYALDGDSGAQVWMRNLGAPMPLSRMGCGNIDPFGITGTPVIDLATRRLYVDAMVTPDEAITKQHLVFALSIDDGSIAAGWPVDVRAMATSSGTAFNPDYQSQRGGLALVGGTLYAGYGGLFGDCGDYHGWLVSISTSDPASVQAWATSAPGGGIWGPSGVASDGTSVYVTTGNTKGASIWAGGEGLLRFTAGGSLVMPADYWTPTDWALLDTGDLDVGGAGPVLVDLPGSTPSALAVALGKEGNVYLLDRNNLGGVSTPLASVRVSDSLIVTAAAAYTTSQGTYVAFRSKGAICTNTVGGLATIKLVPGAPPTVIGSWCAPSGSGSPIVTTTDGRSDAIVWVLGTEGDGLLHGYDGDTGAVVFDGGATTISGLQRFVAPIAAKGRIYAVGDDGVVVFAR